MSLRFFSRVIIPAQNISKPSAEQAATNAEKSRQKKNPGENKLSPVLTKEYMIQIRDPAGPLLQNSCFFFSYK